MTQTPEPPKEPYYIPIIPAEPPDKNPGRTEGILSLASATIALVIFPPAFGVLGVVLGFWSRHKGAKTLGLSGIILSIISMLTGIALGVLASNTLP